MNPETEGRGGMRSVEEGLSRFIYQYLSRAGIFVVTFIMEKVVGRNSFSFLQFILVFLFPLQLSAIRKGKEENENNILMSGPEKVENFCYFFPAPL